MQKANYGPFYCAGVYPKLAEIFREHGYALAVHGSVASDFDLIAVPWIDAAAAPAHVIERVFEKFVFDKTDPCEPSSAPHGLIKYKLHMSFGYCSLDISFVPRTMADLCIVCQGPLPALAEWSGPACPACTEKAEIAGPYCPQTTAPCGRMCQTICNLRAERVI